MGKKHSTAIDLGRFERACARLGDVVLDPVIWPEVMSDICQAVGASGAALLQGDVRTPDIPRTISTDEMFRHYFREGWHTRDIRAQRAVPLLLNGARVVFDQDILTLEEMRRERFYGEALLPFGYQWSASVGLRAGSALWGLCIQRTSREGPFERRDKAILAALSQRLTEVASLSNAVGRVAVSSATNALNNVHMPAVAVDRFGFVLDVNHAAEAIFDPYLCVRNRRLASGDLQASRSLEKLIERLQATPEDTALQSDPVVVRRPDSGDIIIHVLPVHGAARTPFLGARALLTFTSTEPKFSAKTELLANVFELTPAEANLASIMAEGLSPEQAAARLGISHNTARNQLRAVFAKTATHRQSELVALLSRIQAGGTRY